MFYTSSHPPRATHIHVRAEDAEGGEYGLDGNHGVERVVTGTDGGTFISIGVDGKA